MTEAWGTPALVSELNTTGHERSPHLSDDGLTIWFSRYNGTDYDIWTATRATPTGTWNANSVREIRRLSSSADDECPTTTGDGLRMYLESSRDGTMSIYTSTRVAGDPWEIPTAVPELAAFERPDVLPDGNYMVLTKKAPQGLLRSLRNPPRVASCAAAPRAPRRDHKGASRTLPRPFTGLIPAVLFDPRLSWARPPPGPRAGPLAHRR